VADFVLGQNLAKMVHQGSKSIEFADDIADDINWSFEKRLK